MQSLFILSSSIIALISPIVYARSILRGEAKPHRTTRFVLLVITTLSTISLLAQGDRVAVWLALVSTIQSILIFSLSIKHGMGGWAKLDVLCLVIALAGILIWQLGHNPALGLYAAIAADFTGMVPAIKKTYLDPATEIWQFFLLDTIAATCSLLALQSWQLHDFAYPLYILCINALMVVIILRPMAKTHKKG